MNHVGYFSEIFVYGDVPKWLKGPHSKCGRSGNRRESSNLSISACKTKTLQKIYLSLRYHLTIVAFECIIAKVDIEGDWSNGMIGVSKTFGGSSILSSPVFKKTSELVSEFGCLRLSVKTEMHFVFYSGFT